MGYRIVYGDGPGEPKPEKSHLRSLTAAFALAFVILVRLFWPQGTELLRETLLPGNQAALEQLRECIQAGAPLGDAVTAFCREVVEEALGETD